MAERPRIDVALLADLLGRVPSRPRKRLEGAPDMAEAWEWREQGGRWTIATDGGETVALSAASDIVLANTDVSCTCLLSPACLHVAAVVSRLEPVAATKAEETSPADGKEPTEASTDEEMVTLTPAQMAVVKRVQLVVAGVLGRGRALCGFLDDVELLRLSIAARSRRLLRLASHLLALRRLVTPGEGERSAPSALRREFTETIEHLASLGAFSDADAAPAVPASLLGRGRRFDASVSGRLTGVFCEPIVSLAGMSGVVTWLVDGSRRLHAIADIRPGAPTRARGAHDESIALGDCRLSHRALSRAAIDVRDVAVSEDGRLSRGRKGSAVRASGADAWSSPIAELWMKGPASHESEFAFLEGRLRRANAGEIELTPTGGGSPWRLALTHDAKAAMPGLSPARLAGLFGRPLRIIVRRRDDLSFVADLLSIVLPSDDVDASRRLDLGLDAIEDLGPLRPVVPEAPSVAGDPSAAPDPIPAQLVARTMEPLVRRMEQLAAGGWRSVGASRPIVLAEAQTLRRRGLAFGARCLETLSQLCEPRIDPFTHTQEPPDTGLLLRTYIAMNRYLSAVASSSGTASLSSRS